MNDLVKWIVIVAILFFVFRIGMPWLKQQSLGNAAVAEKSSSCGSAAERVSSAWGAGLGRFTNPPYDLGAWSSFRSDIDARVSQAETECRCAEASCEKGKAALRDLGSLVSDLDSSIRGGSPPPGDIVQRQEAIDNAIEQARDLERAGK